MPRSKLGVPLRLPAEVRRIFIVAETRPALFELDDWHDGGLAAAGQWQQYAYSFSRRRRDDRCRDGARRVIPIVANARCSKAWAGCQP